MNNLLKNVRNSKKLNIVTNPKRHKISISSLDLKSNLIDQNKNSISPNENINKIDIFKIKNYTEENKNNENNKNNKSAFNLTTMEIINKPVIITECIKKIFLNSIYKKKNKTIKENQKYNKTDNIGQIAFNIKENEKEIVNMIHRKERQKRYRHKQVKRENKNPLYKIEPLKNLKESKTKNIRMPINKRITYNNVNNSKKNKNKNFLDFNKSYIRQIKSNEKYKENKENIEQNNNNKSIDYLRKKLKDKTNFIYKYRNLEKSFESEYSQQNLIEKINQLNKEEKEKEKYNEIYFNENELNESNTKINKVLYFETTANGLFNRFKINDKKNLNLSLTHSCKNINDKKEITDVGDINNDKKVENENIKNKIKNNLDYNNADKKDIIIIKKNFIRFRKFKTDATLDNSNLENQIKNSNKNNSKENNLNINQNYYYTLESNINLLKINRELVKGKKKLKSINLNLKKENKKLMFHYLDLFYKIFENKNFAKIIFSFCEKDIHLLNKLSLISKNIYKSIKPFIYSKISIIIKKYNENNITKNKIKLYLMQNNSSLLKLSPAILRKKYTDLIFENNKYDIDIKKDLTRTFPNNSLFKYGNIYYNKLYHILTAFSNYNKNIGYVQGINFLAAHIIYFFKDEIDEFIFLDAMIHKFEFDKILDNNLNNQFFERKLKNINYFLLKQLPKLNKFLSDNKLNFDFFITNWILTLFSDSMKTEILVIIWDYLIIFGMKFFRYFILNILLLYENDILNSTQDNITYIKKNILRNEKFYNNSDMLIKNTIQMIINNESII